LKRSAGPKPTMASVKERIQKSLHLKSGVLALAVGVIEAVVASLATSMTRFSVSEFAFAFVLTYTIALGIFSTGRQI
jgi:hypothetical protein